MRFIFLVLFLVLFGSSNEVNATAIYLCEVEKWSQYFKQMEQTKSRYFTISKPPSRGALAIKEQSNPFGVIFRANDALNYQSKENLNEVFVSFSKKFVEVYYSVEEKYKHISGKEFLFTYGYRTDKCPLIGHDYKYDFPKCKFKFIGLEDQIAEGVCEFSHYIKCEVTKEKVCPRF